MKGVIAVAVFIVLTLLNNEIVSLAVLAVASIAGLNFLITLYERR